MYNDDEIDYDSDPTFTMYRGDSFYDRELLERYNRNKLLDLRPYQVEENPFDENYGRWLSNFWMSDIGHGSQIWRDYESIPKEELNIHLEFYELKTDFEGHVRRLFLRPILKIFYTYGLFGCDMSRLSQQKARRQKLIDDDIRAKAQAAAKAEQIKKDKIAAHIASQQKMERTFRLAREARLRQQEEESQRKIVAEAIEAERIKIFPQWLRYWAREHYKLGTVEELSGLVNWIIVVISTCNDQLAGKLTIKKIYKLLKDRYTEKSSFKTEKFYCELAILLINNNYAENLRGQAGNTIGREALPFFKHLNDLCRVSRD